MQAHCFAVVVLFFPPVLVFSFAPGCAPSLRRKRERARLGGDGRPFPLFGKGRGDGRAEAIAASYDVQRVFSVTLKRFMAGWSTRG